MRRLVTGVSLMFAASVSAQSLTDPNLVISPYLTGLTDPTGIRFTGPNEGFVIQKGGTTGTVRRFVNGSLTTVLSVPVASDDFERGLLGIALDPQYSANKHVYLYRSAGASGAWVDNRLERYTFDGAALTAPATLATFGASGDGQASGGNHNGGVLTFGPDGKLYGVTGDLNRNRVEQNNVEKNNPASVTSASTGGLFRLNTDGTAPDDNPFTGSFDRWYAYGVRNSFGLAFDPATGNLWDTENGPGDYDEINLVTRAMNSGWSQIMGPESRNVQNTSGSLNILPGAVYQDPKFSFQDTIGITSIQFLHGSSWGSKYDDAVLVGENNSPRLWLFRLNAARDGFVLADGLDDGVLDPNDVLAAFGAGFSVTTDIQIGPDGAVYVASLGSGTVYRIAPVAEPNQWLLALAGLGAVGLAVRRRRRSRHAQS